MNQYIIDEEEPKVMLSAIEIREDYSGLSPLEGLALLLSVIVITILLVVSR